jgi:hypothetical protein
MVVLGLSLSACAGSSSDQPTDADYDDVAKSVGSVVAANGGGEVATIEDAASISVGALPIDLSLEASGEVRGSRFGLTYSYMFECSDSLGNSLDVCDESTDTADVDMAWSGEIVIPNELTASVERSGQWTMTNIQSGTASIDGVSSFDFDASFDGDDVDRRYHFSYSAEYDHIVVEMTPSRLVSGTIRYDISADRFVSVDGGDDIDVSFDIDAVLTFDADGNATLVLDGTRTYDVDVATGHVTLSRS